VGEGVTLDYDHSRNTRTLWERACSGRRSDDSDGTVGMYVGAAAVIAGKPAPTGLWVVSSFVR